MAPNPISHQEIEAFSRLRRIDLTAWEVDLLCRMDDAVLTAWSGDRPKPKPKTPEAGPVDIPVSNPSGIAGMLRGIAVKKAAAKSVAVPQPKR